MPYPEGWLKSAIEAAGADAFPLNVPEGTSPPFVVYSRTGTVRDQDLGGAAGTAVGTFAVDIYADGYLDVKNLADAVRAQVNDFSGSGEGVTIQWSHLTEEVDGDPVFMDGRDKPTYLVQQTLQVVWEE